MLQPDKIDLKKITQWQNVTFMTPGAPLNAQADI